MSIKAVHLVFVTALSGLAFGFAAWQFRNYAQNHAGADLAWAVGSLVGGLAVVYYGIKVFKKLKNLSYL